VTFSQYMNFKFLIHFNCFAPFWAKLQYENCYMFEKYFDNIYI
jgi:hypothetical protein